MACEICGDRGIILEGEAAVPCGCVKLAKIKNLIKNANLPEKYIGCSLDVFSFKYYPKDVIDPETGLSCLELAKIAHRAAGDFIQRFLKDPKTDGLLFAGMVGSGKTHLACSIANALIKHGRLVLFVEVSDLLDRIRSTYDPGRSPDDLSEFQLLDTARQVPLLILDDLGAHNYTEWTKNKIYSIINYRLNQRLPVIVTTNIKLDDITEYLGERTTSRLLEMCSSYRLTVDIDIRAVRRKEKDLKY
ncbi:ATP-binding protein [Pelotomaculum propionicicum]|uniref:ATP-binding protein n=1 Tax=Pelotomaculum propionicicum TaxID=258475 RepID=UPI003B7E88E0